MRVKNSFSGLSMKILTSGAGGGVAGGGTCCGAAETRARRELIIPEVMVDVLAGISIRARSMADQLFPSERNVRIVEGTPEMTTGSMYGPLALSAGTFHGEPAM